MERGMKYLLIAALMLPGCSSVPTILKEAAYVSVEMSDGAPIDAVRSVKLTSTQAMQVNHAMAEYESFKLKWAALLDDPVNLNRFSEEFKKDYSELRKHVLNVEQVVRVKWVEYTTENQMQLLEYLDHVKNLDANVNKFYSEKRYWDAAKTSLIVIATLLEAGVSVAK